MYLEQIFILLLVCQNVLLMITKNKTFFNNLNELGNAKSEENGTSIEQKSSLIAPPEVQLMTRGPGDEYILQWFDRYDEMRQNQSEQMSDAKNNGTTEQFPFQFIKIHIKEMETILEIDAQVTEEEGTTVEICLCDEKYGICDGPFEAIQNFGGKIDKKIFQCVNFNYQTILTMNKMVNQENKLMVKAQFKMNYHWEKNQKEKVGKKEEEEKSLLFWLFEWSNSAKDENIPQRLDQEFFLKISYESKAMKKISQMWTVHKDVRFAMIPSPKRAKM